MRNVVRKMVKRLRGFLAACGGRSAVDLAEMPRHSGLASFRGHADSPGGRGSASGFAGAEARVQAAAYERRALGIGSHWPFDQWGRFLPEHTTAVSLLDRLLHHSIVVVTEGESFRMRQARTRGPGRLTKK
ncbi:ATP-binding protein [Streptosporangium sp. OZ121]|uniref:ATP-binding protein n=1 Tax=Streptosporangium sp. OZ121 TaxID=3444183 RepID=UPI003F7AF63E